MKVMAYEECESDWGEEEKFTRNVKDNRVKRSKEMKIENEWIEAD